MAGFEMSLTCLLIIGYICFEFKIIYMIMSDGEITIISSAEVDAFVGLIKTEGGGGVDYDGGFGWEGKTDLFTIPLRCTAEARGRLASVLSGFGCEMLSDQEGSDDVVRVTVLREEMGSQLVRAGIHVQSISRRGPGIHMSA